MTSRKAGARLHKGDSQGLEALEPPEGVFEGLEPEGFQPVRRRFPKERLDKLLSDRGLAESRTKAQALIMAGRVKVNGERADKAGTAVRTDCVLEVEGRRWVSRGAFKLLKALEVFPFDPSG
ncbi:MAG: hypothetical protein LBL51_05660, partial [Synergistaceae bacterium]|nr:hypothetical protein [Synergistaceae bacterium]